MKKRFFFCTLFIFLTVVLIFTGCSGGGRNRGTDEHGVMNIDFGEDGMIRNGTEYFTYQVENGKKGVISVSVSRVSGGLDLDIYPVGHRDTPEYTGRDLDSASFDVIVTEPGEYMICVTAKKFVGNYEINWKTEEYIGK